MNDERSPVPNLPAEEVASAYLDGELPAEARAVVEADPRLMAMVSAHGAVRDAVSGPVVALGADERDRLVSTALAAMTPASAPSPVSRTDGAQVVGLAAAQRARSRRLVQVAAGGLAALAAVGVLALVMTRNDSRSTGQAGDQLTEAKDTAAPSPNVTVAAAAAGSGSGAGSEAPAEDQSGLSAASAAPAPAGVAPEAAIAALVDLGPLANRADLIAAGRPFATVAAPTGTGVCPPYSPPLATATFQGTPAYLVVIESSAAGNRVALVDATTCAVLVKVDLAEQ
jgi:hypothetical protein